jgi:phosphoserine phosphatase
VQPVAERLGFDDALATALAVGIDGRLTGLLTGANVRGPEKVRVLERWLGPAPAYLWAYGDSAGDRALWERADQAVRIRRRRRIGRSAT